MLRLDRMRRGGVKAKGTALAKVLACWDNRKKAIVAGV